MEALKIRTAENYWTEYCIMMETASGWIDGAYPEFDNVHGVRKIGSKNNKYHAENCIEEAKKMWGKVDKRYYDEYDIPVNWAIIARDVTTTGWRVVLMGKD